MKLGKNKDINQDYCELIKNRVLEVEDTFVEKFGNRKILHLSGALNDPFWKDISDNVKLHLEQNTYPYDKPVESIWFSIIDGTEDHPGFHGLHQDLYFTEQTEKINEYIDTYVTSVVIHKTDNFKGGQFIIGGDGWTDDLTGPEADFTRASRKGNLSHRLKVIDSQNIGDSVLWTDFTIHGVAEVTEGRRISMMITKTEK